MDPASVAGLLEQSIRLVLKIRKAYKDAKDLPQFLERHEKKLQFVLAIIHAIQDEEVLQTATVTMQLKGMNDVVEQIVICVKTLDRESKQRNTVTNVLHQMAHGKSDAKTLADLMDDLEEAKVNLALVMQLANIGLKKSKENSRVMLADPEAIEQADQVLVGVFGEGGGLQLAKLIKGRPRRAEDGRVEVDSTDIAKLYDDVTSSASALRIPGTAQSDPDRVERVIIANTAEDDAKMINGPLGDDIWKDVNVKILNNSVRGRALMVNWGISMEDARELMREQEKNTIRAFEERKEIREYEERKQIREMEERMQRHTIKGTEENKDNQAGQLK